MQERQMASDSAPSSDASIYARRAVLAPDDDAPFAEWLRDAFGDALRSAFAYDDDVVRFVHVRDDVEERYSRPEFDRVADELLFAASIEDDHQSGLYRLGDRAYAVDGFDEGTVVRVRCDETRGVGFSVDDAADVRIPGFVERVREDAPLPGDASPE